MNAMQPTRIRLLIAIAAVCAALGWGLVQVVASWTGRLVPVPWLAAAALWIIAAALAYWTYLLRPRLQGRLPGCGSSSGGHGGASGGSDGAAWAASAL